MPSISRVVNNLLDPPGAGQPLALAKVLLTARDLSFRVERRVLWQAFELTLRAGERLGITGPSGSGKSLLLRTLAGLEPLQSGELVFEGRSISEWSMPAYRARVVYVAQRPTWREGTVDSALRAPFAFDVRNGSEFPQQRARELLQAMGRDEHFLQQRSERLSGGEAQVAAMVRALLVEPVVLLLDEPTASLDRETAHAIETLILHWVDASPGRACIWTSHDRTQLERIASRVLALGPAS
ncbi:MAG: ATP-binding cassette domain-containing protein [Xanthomonadales bacterium]|nr:ATP-binding cassette domain-containing protein [Xanthomonadales bacterium]